MRKETDREIADCIRKYDVNFVDSGVYPDTTYEHCEKAAFDYRFGNDWKIIRHDDDYGARGSTEMIVRGRGAFYQFSYQWGCENCDTLDKYGPIETVKMLLEKMGLPA